MINFLKFKKIVKIFVLLIISFNIFYASLFIVQYFTISYEKSSEDNTTVNHVSVSSDGKRFVAATEMNIYYYESGNRKGELIYEEEGICCQFDEVELSSNGKYIAVINNNELRIFKTSDGELLWNKTIDGGSDYYGWMPLEISSEGEYIALGANGGKVYLFHRDSSTPLWDYDIGEGEIELAMSSSGDTIVAGNINNDEGDGKVFLFSKETSTPLWNYPYDGDWVHIAISENGKHIAVGSSSNRIYYFDKSSNKPKMNYKISGDHYVRSIDISEDGNEVVVGSSDGKVYLFDTSDSELLSSYNIGGGNVRQVKLFKDGSFIAVSKIFASTFFNFYNIYYFEHGSNTPKWALFDLLSIWEVDFSADGSKFVSGGGSGLILYQVDSCYTYPNNLVYVWSIFIIDILFLIVAIGYRKKKHHYQADVKYDKYKDELKSDINLAKKYRTEGKISDSQMQLKNTLEKVKTAEIEAEAGTSSLKEKRLKELNQVETECKRIDHEIVQAQVREKILEISNKYPRMQIEEIGEECGIQNQLLIINLIKDMIKNKKIIAKYYSSTNSIVFDREQISEDIDELIRQFEEWEQKGKQQKKI